MDGKQNNFFKKARLLGLGLVLYVLAVIVAKYYEGKDEANLSFQEYLRSSEQVKGQVGSIYSITVLKRFIYDRNSSEPGYHLYFYRVKGEHGNMIIELKRVTGSTQIEIRDIR